MKAVVATFNQEKALVGAFVITNLRMDFRLNLYKGIITSDGLRWQEHRRFALKHLKDFGFGKIGLEGVIQEEAEDIVKHLLKMQNTDFRC